MDLERKMAVDGIPVLIVGAGPAGLTLACDPARRRVCFRIVEKRRGAFAITFPSLTVVVARKPT
jgi:2-polyprenyl-6-methoxyphenol hydroxylase-like FAD-dependent oxidoreductase